METTVSHPDPRAETDRIIRDALHDCHHIQALVSSPLITSQWIEKSMVSAEYADVRERAVTLQEALRWAVDQLAPDTPRYPSGTWRPIDDPTWPDPRWWHYSLLRHKYIEPIPPDEFFDGSRLTGTLIALTGIPGRGAFYSILRQALKRVAFIVAGELENPLSARVIQRRLLRIQQQKLSQIPDGMQLMGIASVFFGAFSGQRLLEMADVERIPGAFHVLERLIGECFLIELDNRRHLVMPGALRDHIHQQQPLDRLRRRHRAAARFAEEDVRLPDRIRHLQGSGNMAEAGRLLIAHWGALGSRCRFDELTDILDGFRADDLPPDDRIQIAISRGSHLIRFGHFEQARAMFQKLRHDADTPEYRQLALIFLGHICSNIDPDAARRYFAAAETIGVTGRSFARFLYAGMGRFYLSENNIDAAEVCLLRALKAPEHPLLAFASVLLFALTDLYLMKGDSDTALAYANDLVDYAESLQDAHLTALSLGTLGKIHSIRRDWTPAMHYLGRAETLHRERGNLNETARILALTAAIHRQCGRIAEAVSALENALDCYHRLGVNSREKVAVLAELAELCDTLSRPAAARRYWLTARSLAIRPGLHAAALERLERIRSTAPSLRDPGVPDPFPPQGDSSLHASALALAARNTWISTGDLIAAAGVGRTKAFSTLKSLVESGRLLRTGSGRACRYRTIEPGEALHGYPGAEPILPGGNRPASTPALPDELAHAAGTHFLTGFVIDWIQKLGFITSPLLSVKAGVSAATAKRILAELVRTGRITMTGRGKSTRYVIRFSDETDPDGH